MAKLRAGQIWQDLHPQRRDRFIQIKHVASNTITVISSNNRTSYISKRSFISHPKNRLRFKYISNQPDPKLDWDSGLRVTANQLKQIGEQLNDNH